MQRQAEKDIQTGTLDEKSVNAYFHQHMQKVRSCSKQAKQAVSARISCQEQLRNSPSPASVEAQVTLA